MESNPLFYPKKPTEALHQGSQSATSASRKDDKRIYIGNLDPAIDEYTVVKLFTPYGRIANLDFMFHWHGPKKGTPRGYCFLEYETTEQAGAAVKAMNKKTAPVKAESDAANKKRPVDSSRPTNFSLLKTGSLKNASMDEKIKAMEKKLAQMAAPPARPTPPVHPSLPPKPRIPESPASSASGSASSQPHRRTKDVSNRAKPY
ncbi:hypothetical protein DFQ27_000045 [Actinomortierella ambigua]|uniref:RRM domain-containing protein n=1 Tax=Actinomortierella ambigua TaxID=1343610 RepID=A0A9P6QNJ4_9FUNG|nr:hypothetical protein DFQ27_000045 [Actinomortierella ambigua]